jgi:hypothetical protein
VSRRRFQHIKSILLDDHIIDDVIVLKTAEVVVSWRIEAQDGIIAEICTLAREFGRDRFVQRSEMYFLAGLRILAKYGDEDSVQGHVLLSKGTWTVSSYLARQVAAVTPRLTRPDILHEIRGGMLQYGQLEAVRVLEHLDLLRTSEQLPVGMEWYLGPRRGGEGSYPLHKFLILMQMLRSATLSAEARARLKGRVRHQIGDPIYEKQLEVLWGSGRAKRSKSPRHLAAQPAVAV